MKIFNTTSVCIPSKHYMVDLSERVLKIKRMVDDGKYFTINRARQYGKTTTIEALRKKLGMEYTVVSLDFQDISDAVFQTEGAFVQGMARILCDARDFMGADIQEDYYEAFQTLNEKKTDEVKLDQLFRIILRWCNESQKPVVLIVDEVDSATNNQVFMDFLAQLRSFYLKREKNPLIRTFHSVILAGVTDVKHLRGKIRDNADTKENSPWNIAADFRIDMSLPEDGIRDMLEEYETDHHAGMDTSEIARQIRAYTNGYPFLVSRLCELIDTRACEKYGLKTAWTHVGIDVAVKLLLAENNPLFQSLTKNLNNCPTIKAAIRGILMEGARITYNAQQDEIIRMQMIGLIRNDHNTVRVDNRLFETMLYNLFLTEEELKQNVFSRTGDFAGNQFVENDRLNVRLILERFIQTYSEIFGPLERKFQEKDGRELFLLYLKPIINGTGNYYIEAQTRDQTRTDVIIDYLGQQYIIELKIWYGNKRHEEGEKQITGYLDYFGLRTGYMLSFNFNKKKVTGVRRVVVGEKVLYEGTV